MALSARESCVARLLGSFGMTHCNRHMCQLAGGGWRAASRLSRVPSAQCGHDRGVRCERPGVILSHRSAGLLGADASRLALLGRACLMVPREHAQVHCLCSSSRNSARDRGINGYSALARLFALAWSERQVDDAGGCQRTGRRPRDRQPDSGRLGSLLGLSPPQSGSHSHNPGQSDTATLWSAALGYSERVPKESVTVCSCISC